MYTFTKKASIVSSPLSSPQSEINRPPRKIIVRTKPTISQNSLKPYVAGKIQQDSLFNFLKRRVYPDVIEKSIHCTIRCNNSGGDIYYQGAKVFRSTSTYNVLKLPIFDHIGKSSSFVFGIWQKRKDLTLNREFGNTLVRAYLEHLKISFIEDVEMVSYIDSVLEWKKIYIHSNGKNLNFSQFEQETEYRPTIEEQLKPFNHSLKKHHSHRVEDLEEPDGVWELPMNKAEWNSDGVKIKYMYSILLPYKKGTTIVWAPMTIKGKDGYTWEKVCAGWIHWCFQNGLAKLKTTEGKKDDRTKCTHKHGYHEHSLDGEEKKRPLCHTPNASEGSCPANCPGIHLIYPDGFTREGDNVNLVTAYKSYKEKVNEVLKTTKMQSTFANKSVAKAKELASRIVCNPTYSDPLTTLKSGRTSDKKFGEIFSKMLASSSSIPVKYHLKTMEDVKNFLIVMSQPSVDIGDNCGTTPRIYCECTRKHCKRMHHGKGIISTLKYRIIVAQLIKYRKFPIDFFLSVIFKKLAENQEILDEMWLEMQEGKVLVSSDDIKYYQERRDKLKLGQINMLIDQVKAHARKHTNTEQCVDPLIISKVEKLAEMNAENQHRVLAILIENELPTCGLKCKSIKELKSFSEKERIKLERIQRQGRSMDRLINKKKKLDGFSVDRPIHKRDEDYISKEKFATVLELLESGNTKDISWDLITKWLKVSRTAGIWSRRDFCDCDSEKCRKRHVGAHWPKIFFGPSEDGVIDNICLTFMLFLPTFMCPKSKYGAVADILGLPTEFYEERGCRAATETAGACNCKQGRHHNTYYMDISSCFKQSKSIEKSPKTKEETKEEIQVDGYIKEIKTLRKQYTDAKAKHIEIVTPKEPDERGFIRTPTRDEKKEVLDAMYKARDKLHTRFSEIKMTIANTILKQDDYKYVASRTVSGDIEIKSPEMIIAEVNRHKEKERVLKEKQEEKTRIQNLKEAQERQLRLEKWTIINAKKIAESKRQMEINQKLQVEQDKLEAQKAKEKQKLEDNEWDQYTHVEAQIGLVPLKKKKAQRVVLMPSKNARKAARKAAKKSPTLSQSKEKAVSEDNNYDIVPSFNGFDGVDATEELDVITYIFESKKSDTGTQIAISGFKSKDDAKNWFKQTKQLKNSCTSKKCIGNKDSGTIMFPPPKKENVRKRTNLCVAIMEELVKSSLVTDTSQIRFSPEFKSNNSEIIKSIHTCRDRLLKVDSESEDDSESDDEGNDFINRMFKMKAQPIEDDIEVDFM